MSEQTSESMRYLMRSNATHGSASFANVEGYYVGGKTGTADKIFHGHYSNDKVFTTFMAISPANKPKYLYLVLYDQPQAAPGDGGYHTAAYNSGRVDGSAIAPRGTARRPCAACRVPAKPVPDHRQARLWRRRRQDRERVMSDQGKPSAERRGERAVTCGPYDKDCKRAPDVGQGLCGRHAVEGLRPRHRDRGR